jgi:thiamine-phosphate pyrophosphorylase
MILPFSLIWVTHSQRYPKVDTLGLYRKLLDAGLGAAILREKNLPQGELYRLAQEMSCATKSKQARFGISDRADICALLKLKWLHLPSDSAPVADVRKLVTEKVLISKSIHTAEEATAAEEAGCNLLIAGSVFPTKSHGGEPLGLDALEKICTQSQIPVFAIGGITAGNVKQVHDAGAAGVAVVGALYEAKKPDDAIAELNDPWV